MNLDRLAGLEDGGRRAQAKASGGQQRTMLPERNRDFSSVTAKN